MKRRALEAWLRDHGAAPIRGVGKHDVWRAASGRTASVPRHREIVTFTGRAICDQLGIDRPPFK